MPQVRALNRYVDLSICIPYIHTERQLSCVCCYVVRVSSICHGFRTNALFSLVDIMFSLGQLAVLWCWVLVYVCFAIVTIMDVLVSWWLVRIMRV